MNTPLPQVEIGQESLAVGLFNIFRRLKGEDRARFQRNLWFLANTSLDEEERWAANRVIHRINENEAA